MILKLVNYFHLEEEAIESFIANSPATVVSVYTKRGYDNEGKEYDLPESLCEVIDTVEALTKSVTEEYKDAEVLRHARLVRVHDLYLAYDPKCDKVVAV